MIGFLGSGKTKVLIYNVTYYSMNITVLPLQLLKLRAPKRLKRHRGANDAFIHPVTHPQLPTHLPPHYSMLHAPVSVGKQRTAHLHRPKSVSCSAHFRHPDILNTPHTTHFGHGYAAGKSNCNAALAKECGSKNFFCNQCAA
jgi:hypothetical protein